MPTTFLGALQWMRTGEYWESIRQRMVPIPTSVEIPANVRPSDTDLHLLVARSSNVRGAPTESEHDTVCVCSDEETRPAKKRRRQTSEDSASDRDLRSRSPVTLKSNDGFWWVVDGHRFVSSRRTFKRRTVSSISVQTPSPLSPPAISPTSVVDTPTASYSPTEVGNTPSPSTLIPPPRPPPRPLLRPPPRQPYREVSSPTEMPTPTRCPTSPINISDDDQEVKVVLKQTPKYMPRRITTTIPPPDQEDDWIRTRAPGTIKVKKVMPPHPGETIDHYFERLERNWEPDPDREGLLRKRTQATPTLDWPTTVARCREFVMETKAIVTWPTLGWFSRHPQSAQSRQGERPASGSSARDRTGRTRLDETAVTEATSRFAPSWKEHGRKYSSDEDGDGPNRDSNVIIADVAQQSTSKIPPYWSPELERKGYPFRIWSKDVRLWCVGTELNTDKQGPAIIQRLGDTARELLREAPLGLIQYGREDAMGNLISTGVDVILEGLNRRFGQLDVESSITTIIELLTFRRNRWESIDEALTRFELLRSRTDSNAAGFQMPEAVLAWQLLVALNIPRTVWPLLFQPFGGRLPITDDQFQDMCTAIRQQGHIAEHTHMPDRVTSTKECMVTDKTSSAKTTTAAVMNGMNKAPGEPPRMWAPLTLEMHNRAPTTTTTKTT